MEGLNFWELWMRRGEFESQKFDFWLDVVHVDIARFVGRTIQMPFHVTLLGAHYGSNDRYNMPNGTGGLYYRSEDSIDPLLDKAYKAVSGISETFGNNWTGSEGISVQVSPTTKKPSVHNQPAKAHKKY